MSKKAHEKFNKVATARKSISKEQEKKRMKDAERSLKKAAKKERKLLFLSKLIR